MKFILRSLSGALNIVPYINAPSMLICKLVKRFIHGISPYLGRRLQILCLLTNFLKGDIFPMKCKSLTWGLSLSILSFKISHILRTNLPINVKESRVWRIQLYTFFYKKCKKNDVDDCLAHLENSAKVIFWDIAVSVVRCCALYNCLLFVIHNLH